MAQESVSILLAEDTGPIRVMLQEVFEDEGYRVISCTSAAEAIDTLSIHVPDLVISDMHMERPSAGLSLLLHLRHVDSVGAIPMILYSADAPLLRTLRPEVAGLNVVTVPKPFEIDSLVMLSKSIIRQGRAKERAASAQN
jgi:CheY-like chemotaxis protein